MTQIGSALLRNQAHARALQRKSDRQSLADTAARARDQNRTALKECTTRQGSTNRYGR
jgi:hypothetical protein